MKIVRKALRLNTEILMSICVDFGLDRFEKAAAHAHNSTFAIGGVSCSADSFVVAESSVLRNNICGKKPAHRKSANRWL